MALDDEHDPPIYFEHDPESDDLRDGYWTKKSGTRVYATGHMDDVNDLASKGKADLGDHPDAPALSQAGPYAAPPPMPNTDPLSDAEKAPLEASPEETQALERAPGAPPQAGEAPPPDAAAAPAPLPPAPAAALPPAPSLGAGQSGSRLPIKSLKDTASEKAEQSAQSSQSVSRTGSAQSQGEFEAQQADIAKGYEGQARAQDEGSAGLVGALKNRQQALAQMGADKEAATAGAQASAEARKAQVIKKYQEIDSRKTDMNGLWKDKGALGTTLGLLGVALRSLTATKFGGPNTALQAIQEEKKQNLQAQMEDRNSELRGLERELGSIEAAAPMLEARMNDAMSKRIDAMTIDEKSATVVANAKQMKAQLETEKAQKMAESAKAYHGTLATQQSQQAGQTMSQGRDTAVDREANAGGKKPMTPKEVAETDKAWEAAGKNQQERAILWQKNGYDPPTGKTEADYKREKEAAGGDADKRSEDQGKAAGVQDASANYARTLGFVHDRDGQWVPGGKPGTEAEQKAARTALRTGLHMSGVDEKTAESTTPEAGGMVDRALGYMPLLYHFANATTPEDQAAQLNAAEGVIRPRLNPADRAASTATERGAVRGKKVGNMNAGTR